MAKVPLLGIKSTAQSHNPSLSKAEKTEKPGNAKLRHSTKMTGI